MKITVKELKAIIKEEVSSHLVEVRLSPKELLAEVLEDISHFMYAASGAQLQQLINDLKMLDTQMPRLVKRLDLQIPQAIISLNAIPKESLDLDLNPDFWRKNKKLFNMLNKIWMIINGHRYGDE